LTKFLLENDLVVCKGKKESCSFFETLQSLLCQFSISKKESNIAVSRIPKKRNNQIQRKTMLKNQVYL